MSHPIKPAKSFDDIHDETLEAIQYVADSPVRAIPLVLIGWVGAVFGIAGGFGLLCLWACHR